MQRILFPVMTIAAALTLASGLFAQSVGGDSGDDIEIIDIDTAAFTPQTEAASGDTAILEGIADFETAMPGVSASSSAVSVIRKGRVITGAVLAGVPWIFSVIGARIVSEINSSWCSDCDKIGRTLWIPIAGPALAEFIDDRNGLSPVAPLMFLWTGAQAAGVALLISGFIGQTQVVENYRVSLAIEPLICVQGGGGAALRMELRGLGK